MSERSLTPSTYDAGSSNSESLRVSQRQPLSCTECTRRKTRCDKVLPCSNCRKRGVPERCRVQQIIPSKSLRTVNAVQSLRQETISAQSRLEDRLAQLERLIQSSLGKIPNSQVTDPPPITTESQPSRLEVSRQSIGTDSGRNPSGAQDEESVAAATLEFLALGRVRAKSPGGKDEDQYEEADEEGSWDQSGSNEDNGLSSNMEVDFSWITEDGQESPSRGSSRSATPHAAPPQPTPAAQLSGLAGYKAMVRNDILSRLPSTSVGRALVRWDVENVSWLHCCYHSPTFLSESELFWSELGADDVEVNWSFLALMFGVLMSALYHMPSSLAQRILPNQNRRQLVGQWFDCCLLSLNEANWMSSHSLYAVQCIAVIISPANHLGHADLYYTMLGAAIKVAQALNVHRLGPDPYSGGDHINGQSSIAREVRKRTWGQLIIQDWFHLGFNNTCSIHANQFDTPSPLICADHSQGVTKVLPELPTVPSHTHHLMKLASLVNEVYSHASSAGDVPYDIILRTDGQVRDILAAAPAWMTSEEIPLHASWPSWVEWQRRVFMVSSAHKVIVLHRPYLGRAFRGEAQYAKSREACLLQARFITNTFCQCSLETFRRTWTVLAHTLAACIILILEASHHETEARDVYEQMTIPVKSALSVFVDLAEVSDIAKKGAVVLASLLERGSPGQNSDRQPAQKGAFDRELDRAARLFRRPSSPNTTNRSALPQPTEQTYVPGTEFGMTPGGAPDYGVAWADFVLQTRDLDTAITGIPYELETAVDWSTFSMSNEQL
ncbi:hypothetical protein IAR55_000714 [Kwoniella newhampshirensis]|uniref:Zn(2)-C6 fungal-type domain-containing protein n=1 Tax=Kwoniella newhampshirensis TaxID=1651941 RepID=A0AAW0Z3M3_9TREE